VERRQHLVRAEGREGAVPPAPLHLLEPARLCLATECLHPLQPGPALIRYLPRPAPPCPACGRWPAPTCPHLASGPSPAARCSGGTRSPSTCPPCTRQCSRAWPPGGCRPGGAPPSGSPARCPLAWLGCAWSCPRRAPLSADFSLVFSRRDDDFAVRHEPEAPPPGRSDRLSLLPAELLQALLAFLHPIDLRSLSLTCSRLREVGCPDTWEGRRAPPQACRSLLPARGRVAVVWQRQRAVGQRRRGAHWVEAAPAWSFSSSLGPVPSWREVGPGAVQSHLAQCRCSPDSPRHHEPCGQLLPTGRAGAPAFTSFWAPRTAGQETRAQEKVSLVYWIEIVKLVSDPEPDIVRICPISCVPFEHCIVCKSS
jgi:hypothetical protein